MSLEKRTDKPKLKVGSKCEKWAVTHFEKRPFIALILVFWAIALAGYPVDASVIPEFENVYMAADLAFRTGVSNGQLYEPLNSSGFIGGRIKDALALGPLTLWRETGVFTEDIRDSSGANPSCAVLRNGLGNNQSKLILPESYGSKRESNFTSYCFSEQSVCQRAFSLSRCFENNFRMDAVQGPKIRSHVLCPSVGNAIETIPSVITSLRMDSPTCFFDIVKRWGRVKTFLSGTVPTTPRRGENKLVIEYSDLTITIFWFSFEDSSTVSRDDEFVFRDMEYNDSSGTDLGGCRIRTHHNNEQENTYSHCVLQSGNNSVAMSPPVTKKNNRDSICYGCTLLVSKDNLLWREIIGCGECALIQQQRIRSQVN